MEDTNTIAISGVMTYYNSEKGYGFLKSDETGESTFFHFSATNLPPEQIKPRMRASYIVTINPRRGTPQAAEILLCENT